MISTRDEATVSVVKPSAPERLRANRDTALALAEAGIPVIPTKNKMPASLEWQRLDVEINDEERAAKIEAFNREHNFAPLHIGSTTDKTLLRKWMGPRHNATPSISLGPANLVVLDLDKKKGVDGVELFRAWAAESDIDVSKCPRTVTQSGAEHIYFSNPDHVGCKRNAELQWDLKGVGGQVVAAGAIRAEDGKRYVAAADAPNLIESYKSGTIPPIPMAIVEKFGASTKASASVSSIEEARLVRRLREDEWSSKDDLLDETIGFDLAALEDKDAEFRRLVTQRRSKVDEDKRDESTSGNRWNLAKCLIREFGESFSVLDLAAAYELANERTDGAFGVYVGDNAPGAGEFDNRAIAREWAKLQGSSERKVSEANFGPVQDEDESRAPKEKKAPILVKSFATFKAEYRPARYLIDGIIQRGALYTWTARTGAGKTSLLASASLAIAAKREDVLGIEVKQGRVVYCTFENPADFRAKLLAAQYAHKVTDEEIGDRLDVIDAWHDIGKIRKALTDQSECAGIIIDTLQAAFPGTDSNDNAEVLKFVKQVRTLTTLPGNPAVIVAAHPIKNAQRDNLVPYGGGAVLNEVDGNLTLFKEVATGIVEMHHQGKFRGTDFEPKRFSLEIVACPSLLDENGRALRLPVMKPIDADSAVQREETVKQEGAAKDAALLAAMIAKPEGSQGDWAVSCGCAKSSVNRALKRMQDVRLVDETGGRWIVSKKGRALVENVRQRAEAEGQRFEVADDEAE